MNTNPQPPPPPGQAPLPPSQPPAPARRRGLVAVLIPLAACGALFVLALGVLTVVAASNDNDNTPVKVGDANEPAAVSEAPTTNPPKQFKVGDVVKVGTWTLTVHSSADPYTPGGDFPMKPANGHRFVQIEATVENTGSDPETVSSIMSFELQDDQGRSFNPTFVSADAKTLDGTVDAGGKRRGTLSFEVPNEIPPAVLALRFQPNLIDRTVVIINLK